MAIRSGMRVAIDAVSARPGGGLTFLLGQLPHLERCADLTVFANSEVAPQLRRELSKAEVRTLPLWGTPLPLRLLWENFVLPRALDGYDVLYLVGGLASLATRKPQVVVVQSAYTFGPEAAGALACSDAPFALRVKIQLQRLLGRLALRRAAVLVATSEFMASQVRAVAKPDIDLRVVPIAGLPLAAALDAIGRDLPTTKPFALSVGSDLPHKDRFGLVRSWPGDLGLDLVLVGSSHSSRSFVRLEEEIARRSDVHWVGPVANRARLAQLYAAASLVVAHSHLEGFGMTTLEAMESETPVVASDIPGHREVCGGAAVYYDPDDRQSLASAVRKVLDDEDLQKELVEAGRLQVERFSWEQNARQTCAILHEVRDRSTPRPVG